MPRELLIDDAFTAEKNALEFRQHFPVPRDSEPTQPQGYYQTVIRDPENGRCLLYYRGVKSSYTGELFDGHPGEYVGVALSTDGIHWTYPELNLFPDAPANAVLYGRMETHNFAPFLDTNPACPHSERFKAFAGIVACGGLNGFYSDDGIRWKQYGDKPLLGVDAELIFSFDSQNVSFWSEAEEKYVLYYRVYKTNMGEQLRAVARKESTDFLHWSGYELIDLNRSGEHLYVSLLAPYVRAKRYYVGTPTRFFDNRGAATDITVCFTRDGHRMLRPFPEAWITPGLDPERWGNRSNYLACNMVLTKPEELSFYHIKSRVRYTLRSDGFISLHAGIGEGFWKSRVLEYGGELPHFNIATSAGGAFRAALLSEEGGELPGFGFDDCVLFFGDKIDHVPEWRGGIPSLKKSDRFRIACRLSEADFFSFTY